MFYEKGCFGLPGWERRFIMAIERKGFGTDKEGRQVTLYTITNSKGMQASVTDFGAILVSLMVPDANGEVRDVVLGYDSAESYWNNSCFFGSTIGPSANRIADARFTIDGITCQLDVNDNDNNLHSHRELGYHKRMWEVRCADDSVTFRLKDKDGSLGFPGNKEFEVTYTLREDNALQIHYHAVSDKKTVINPTNHTYFNLKGQGNGTIQDHELQLNASCYTPVAAGSIPTGEIAPVAGTPMDFTASRTIGEEIDADFEQLKLTGGYDHNWVIDGWDGSLRQFATAKAPDGSIVMKAFTTLPGVQFYAGNYIEPDKGKNGASYDFRGGFCLETQYYPNSANEPAFPSCIFGEGKEYDSVTVYQFI